MPKIVFETAKGPVAVEAAAGASLMEAAVAGGVPGIVGECGGSAACATCHCVLPAEVYDALPEPEEHEADMLDFADAPRERTSRLGCQVRVTAAMEGIVVRVPGA